MAKSLKDNLVTIIAGLGMLLSTLDTGIINVALSFLKVHFQTTTTTVAFAVTGYALALAIFIMPFGVLSDKLGKLKVSYLGFILFGLSSLLCGAVDNVYLLIVGRILQGIGAAALQSTSAALITTLVSKDHQNSSISILGVMIGLGPVLGPSLGGILLSLNLWRFIFWINLPICLIAICCNHYLLSHIDEQKLNRSLDIIGMIINAIALVFLLIALSLLSKSQVFFDSFVLLIGSLGLFYSLYCFEIKKKAPLIPIGELRRNRQLIVYLFQTFVFGFASAMIFILPPFIFEDIYHLNVGMTGFLVLGAPAGLVIFSRLSGKFNKGDKTQTFIRVGLVLIAFSLIFLMILRPSWSFGLFTLGLFLYGVGGGYFQPSNIASIMTGSSAEFQGSMGAFQRMMQNIAISTGSAIGATCLNIWNNDLLLATRVGWGITLLLIGFSLKGVLQRR